MDTWQVHLNIVYVLLFHMWITFISTRNTNRRYWCHTVNGLLSTTLSSKYPPKCFFFLLHASFLGTNYRFTFIQLESSRVFQLSLGASTWFFFFLEDRQCDDSAYLFSKLAAPKKGQWKGYYDASYILIWLCRKKKRKKLKLLQM